MEHVAAVTGRPFAVTLESYGGAGYAWRLRDVPDGLRLESHESLPPEVGAPPGAPHRVVFTLVATRPGSHEVTFELARPWESVVEQERTFAVVATDA